MGYSLTSVKYSSRLTTGQPTAAIRPPWWERDTFGRGGRVESEPQALARGLNSPRIHYARPGGPDD